MQSSIGSIGSIDKSKTNFVIYSYIVLLIFAGTVDTISKKTLNINHSLGKKFKHPFFVSFIMFLGELVCLFFYYLSIYFEKPNLEENEKEERVAISGEEQNTNVKPELSVWMLIIPTFLDFTATTLNRFIKHDKSMTPK